MPEVRLRGEELAVAKLETERKNKKDAVKTELKSAQEPEDIASMSEVGTEANLSSAPVSSAVPDTSESERSSSAQGVTRGDRIRGKRSFRGWGLDFNLDRYVD